MSMYKGIRWGVIGCGKVTELKSTPAYQKTEGFHVAAVMGRNEGKVQDYISRHNIERYYLDVDSMINNPEIDAIYIATPPDSHKEYALKVAQAGKVCCIEKPLAPTYQDCLAINKAFSDKNIPLFVSYYRRSLPRFQKIKAWLAKNAIGDVRHINWYLSKPANAVDLSKEYNWRTDKNIAPGGYFDDLASHGLDLFNYLLGDIEHVVGLSTNQQGLYSAKDAIVASWLHQSGVTGSGSWNFGCSQREDKVEILGCNGKIEFSVFDEQPIKLISAENTKELFIENPENIQLYHTLNMQKHLHNEALHPSTGDTATHTAWVMDNMLK
jgi:1,5-anhydro-D-fructose reductase (1,5-anhydro-D-mannitol-forming)